MTITDYSIVEQRKIQLITMITQLYDLDLLNAIENLLITSKKDWWQSISDTEKRAIDVGLDDIKTGRLVSHEQVVNEIEERYENL